MSERTTVSEIIAAWLKENGYDGLCGDGCACELSDLAPCCCDGVMSCVAGYKHQCDRECEDQCDNYDREDAWCMRLSKPADPNQGDLFKAPEGYATGKHRPATDSTIAMWFCDCLYATPVSSERCCKCKKLIPVEGYDHYSTQEEIANALTEEAQGLGEYQTGPLQGFLWRCPQCGNEPNYGITCDKCGRAKP